MKSVKNIDAYIEQFPDDHLQSLLRQMRRTTRGVAPQASEAIKYGMPTLVLNGNLVHFAAFKNHIGFYPTPGAILKFQKELSRYQTSKGAIQFPLDRPLPLGLVKKITQYRVKQVMQKSKTTKGAKKIIKK
jgi:uncharacterized protein YdhG (YjbR/CyaY superfamily)